MSDITPEEIAAKIADRLDDTNPPDPTEIIATAIREAEARGEARAAEEILRIKDEPIAIREIPVSKRYCGFCAMGDQEGVELVEGPTNCICGQCAALALDVIRSRKPIEGSKADGGD